MTGAIAESLTTGLFWYPLTFGCLAAGVLISALLVVLSRNIVHSVLWLLVCLLSVAGLFILLDADFLAGVQVLIYCGGIVVLMLFALMLTRGVGDPSERAHNRQFWWGLLAAAGLGAIALGLMRRATWPVTAEAAVQDVTGLLADALLGPYVAAFEITSVVLLVAMIGAIVIARREAA
ncbi:MAG: NADH-quinone oxidoreductase subunit J [Armatimonadetes bacterium]|nr:NADH-quinone oxidoreductase subunit J [Armatimonadota bacterium]